MHRADRRARPSENLASAAIAETLGHAAFLSDRAVVVGNRAGIVEWANPAWTRMTGFPLSEIVSKPISDFLERSAVELELVDFLAQDFLDGRPSTIEFPFETADDRSIWVHLEVQPIRADDGDVTEFVATAADITERHHRDIDSSERNAEANRVLESDRSSDPAVASEETLLSLSAETELACEQALRIAGDHTYFDIVLDQRLPSIPSNRLLLGEIIRLMLEAAVLDANETWGCITVLTGISEKVRSHASAVHPVRVRARQLCDGTTLYLEVHDTSPTLSDDALRAIREGTHSKDPRAHSLAKASVMATAIGGSLAVDSTPGCGTQSLLLLPTR